VGDAISPGVCRAFVLAVLVSGQLTGWPILMGAMLCGVLTAALTQALQTFGKVSRTRAWAWCSRACSRSALLLISLQPPARTWTSIASFNGILEAAV